MQKLDKDRLDKVLSLIKKMNLRFPNAEIARRTGTDKGNVSAYLSGKKPMSDNFYTTFIKEFGEPEDILQEEVVENKPISTDIFLELLLKAVNNTSILVESNKVLVDTNARQTRMLESKAPTADAPEEIPEAWLPKVTAVLGSIAKAGTVGWKSEQEALAELSKLVYGSSRKTQSKGTRVGSGKVSS